MSTVNADSNLMLNTWPVEFVAAPALVERARFGKVTVHPVQIDLALGSVVMQKAIFELDPGVQLAAVVSAMDNFDDHKTHH